MEKMLLDLDMINDIKFLFLDVDGTLTDGKIYMGEHGEIMKAFNIKDGCGIHDVLPKLGIVPVIITARNSSILQNRCKELDITELHQGVKDKLPKMREVLSAAGADFCNAVYMGDDLNDLPCMQAIKNAGGIAACPADAASEVKAICDFVGKKNGGDGAVREFIEFLKNSVLPNNNK